MEGISDKTLVTTTISNLYSFIAREPSNLVKKSSIITDRKSATCFPMSLRWTSYAASKPPKVEWKTQNGRFSYKSGLFSKKGCYKVSLCENCQSVSGEVVRHSLAYLIVHKQFVGDVPLNVNFVHKDTHHCSGSECHRWCHEAVSVATGLLQITPDLLSKKPEKFR